MLPHTYESEEWGEVVEEAGDMEQAGCDSAHQAIIRRHAWKASSFLHLYL